jgi:hypothetical protein
MQHRVLATLALATAGVGAVVVACERARTPAGIRSGVQGTVATDPSSILHFNLYASGGADVRDPHGLANNFDSPGPYTFHWNDAYCPANVSADDCGPPWQPELSDHTSNPAYFPRVPLFANGTKVYIVAQVVAANGATGTDTSMYVIPPTPHGRLLDFNCNVLGQVGWVYPFIDGTGRSYTRNPCTGAVVYKQ